jgi:formate dehydrogenase major subunit
MTPLTVHGRTVQQVGLPYHWGGAGYSTGDPANDLTAISLDPNTHIQEVKAFACDIQPGRRPRGPGRAMLVQDYQRRAGITAETGMEP